MQKLYSSKTFQFFAIIIIASLCLLLDTLTQINFHKMELPKALPQYNAHGITGSVYNPNGKILYDLKALEAWEYPDDQRIFLKGLGINVFHESSNEITYSINSNNGWIDQVTSIGQLGESTVLKMYNSNPAQNVTIFGKDINLNMNNNVFSSNSDARGVQGKATVYTHGFSFDNNKHFLVLTSKVRVIYEE